MTKKTNTANKAPHWTDRRSGPVDKSKRVASRCSIDEKNIVSQSSTRRRREVNYKDLLTIVPGSRKVKGRKSSNSHEKRLKAALAYETKKKQVEQKGTTQEKTTNDKESETDNLKENVLILKPFVQEFRKPVGSKELQKIIGELETQGYTLPKDLITFYQICDGFVFNDPDFSMNFFSIKDVLKHNSRDGINDDEEFAAEFLHSRKHNGTRMWLFIGTEAEFDETVVCCDPNHEDFGAVSYYIQNIPMGNYVTESLSSLMEGMNKGFKLLQKHFTEKELTKFVHTVNSGSSSGYDETDASSILRTIRGWKGQFSSDHVDKENFLFDEDDEDEEEEEEQEED
jgi:SOS response regulatory protein OraA/RecX